MNEKKLSNERVASIVQYEGLEYAVINYMDSSSIADPELVSLWDEAERANKNLEKFLEAYTEEE